MWELLHNADVRRLGVAVGLSLALHAAIAVSVQRQPGDSSATWPVDHATPPLIVRLATAASATALPTAAAAISATPELRMETPAVPGNAPSPRHDAPENPGSLHYFKTSELDRRPFPLKRIEIPVPDSATEPGSVMIRLHISERGRVENAKIVMGTGLAEFEAAALREFSRAQFYPGYRGNLPVRSVMVIEATLRPPGSNQKDRTAPAPVQN